MTVIARLPVEAMRDPRLSRNDWRTLVAVASHASKSDGRAWPSSERLAVQTGMDRRTVRRSLVNLQRLGYLELAGRIPNPHGGKGARIWIVSDGASTAPTADGASTAPTDATTDGASTGRPLAQSKRESVGASTAPLTKNRTDTEAREALACWQDAPESQQQSVAKLVRSSLLAGTDPAAVIAASRRLRDDCSRKATLHPSANSWRIALEPAVADQERARQDADALQAIREQSAEQLRPIHGDDAPAVVDAVVELYGIGALQSVELVPLAEIAAGRLR